MKRTAAAVLLALATAEIDPALARPDSAAAEAARAWRMEAAARAVAARLQARDVAAAQRLRRTEQRAAEQTDRIEALAAQHDEQERRIAALNAQLAAILAPLRGVDSAPLLTLLLAPGSATEAEAAAATLRVTAREIAGKLAALRASEQQADALANALASERAQAASVHAGQVRQAAAIEQDLETARRAADAASARARQAAGRAATAASREASLKDAIASLQARPPTIGTRPAPGLAAGGRAVVPVAGPLMQRFGAATDAGSAAGSTYAPPPSALVSSPCRGQIDFAGPFRSYGKMVIVDCGKGTRFVLAGLDRVDVVPGTVVRAGEPIGRMPDFSPGAHGRPTLYVQVRRGARAVDPGAYLGH